jgi:MATE family, multidrug efflux pump
MTNQTSTFRQEFRPMLGLAWPLVIANLGWMTMGIVDTMMVGRVSPVAIGAVSLGGIVFFTVATFGYALLLGLDTLVPQAFGAHDLDDCRRSLVNGLYLSLPLALILMAAVRLTVPLLEAAGINAAVLGDTIPYMMALSWSIPPLLVYAAFGGYLRGINLVRPMMLAVTTANLLNAGGDWILIYGHWGFPRLGAEGSGWATTLARIYMALVVVLYTLWRERRRLARSIHPLRVDLGRIRRLVALGLPASMQTVVEVAVFATATALIGKLNPVSLAAHQIAMNMVSFTYMVPLGVGSAAAVRVGQALGRGDPNRAAHSGWNALALGAGFMGTAGVAFLIFPRFIARAFTPDESVVRAGAALLLVAAFFQLFDGIQTVVTGALRGAGDTRTPMVCHFLAYWLIGLPLGYVLCFNFRMGARGLWIGLSLALILIGLALLFVWMRRVRNLQPAPVVRTQE